MEGEFRCAAVIPCFNEARAIANVLRAAIPYVSRAWVVDDASSDETPNLAEKGGSTVIRHPTNRGKGASIRAGLAAARAAGFTHAVILDGDGQHDPAEIPKLIEAARAGADLVIGDRMTSCVAMGNIRRFVNRWMSARIEKRFAMKCPDSQSGFRCVRLEAFDRVKLRENRFEVESEMIASFARADLKIVFVPVTCLPAGRPSRIRPIADTIRWFRWWLLTK